MTPRERVLQAVQHREPDRVPLFYRDVPAVEARLRRDLGLPSREALLEWLRIDFRWVEPAYVGPPLQDDTTGRRRDIWGVEYRWIEAGHGGQWEPAAGPLAQVEDPAALDDYPWPQLEWFDFAAVAAQLQRYRDYAIMTAPGVASPGVLSTIQFLLGMERTLTDMLINPDFFQALAARILAFNLAFIERLYAVAGDRIDFFRIGDDFGTQRGLLFGKPQWREFIRPSLAAMSRIAKRHGSRYYQHTCGAVRELIPELLDVGVDVLDPLQVKAAGMAPAELKAEFGGRLCFSGGVDEQELLPRGTPDQVARAVCDLLAVMAPGGGFFLGPTHNFQADIPTANIVAMYQAAWEYQG
ncbi:MAG: uroporphyrinogen-III decarboxylase [Kiritimatiellaeota bacterium]|nr:uroporphyrinogen-III decarboxylase [Kiritimatiellota bacterium]